MNRDKALTIADRIMTRIETDRAIHKDAIADEIQAADALDEIIDVISHDGEKWVHRDGAVFDVEQMLVINRIGATGPAGMPGPFGVDMGDDRVEPVVQPGPAQGKYYFEMTVPAGFKAWNC